MKIVVTDGFTLNSGDLSWQAISQMGELTVYDRTPEQQIVERCRDATIILTNKTLLNKHTLSALPNLRMISVLATGYNVIDVAAANENGVIVCNVPGYGTASVAQHTFALLLELTNAVGQHNAAVKRGEWNCSNDWAFTLKPLTELSGKTMGIIGYGNIGKQVAAIAAAFGMKIIYFNPREKAAVIGEPLSLETVFERSDVVSLHCPLTYENRHMVNKNLLRRMKNSALLINTARGALINENDLAAALNEGMIAGAGLDVLETEPPTESQLFLLEAKNCIITPHNAWMSREARERIMQITKNNIEAFLKGNPINQVNS